MAATTAVIANAALDHLGVGAVRITTLSSDTTREGKVLRAFYPQARQEALKAHDWRCAAVQVALTLVETFEATATREYLYSYRLPENCLVPRRLLWGGVRVPRDDQSPKWTLFADPDSTDYNAGTTYAVGDYVLYASVWYRCILASIGNLPSVTTYWTPVATASGGPPLLLYADEPDAVLEYTADISDPTRFDVGLERAIALQLAFLAAPSITKDTDPGPLLGTLDAKWQTVMSQAVSIDANARKPDPPPVSGYQAARYHGAGGR